MADSDQTGPRPISAPDDMHWGINYLREDIQDIRAEARESRADTKADHASLRQAMEAGELALRSEIGSLRQAMEAGDSALRTEMQTGFARMDDKYQVLLKHIDSRFYWAVGLMATMMGMQAALTTALMKL